MATNEVRFKPVLRWYEKRLPGRGMVGYVARVKGGKIIVSNTTWGISFAHSDNAGMTVQVTRNFVSFDQARCGAEIYARVHKLIPEVIARQPDPLASDPDIVELRALRDGINKWKAEVEKGLMLPPDERGHAERMLKLVTHRFWQKMDEVKAKDAAKDAARDRKEGGETA